MTEDIQKLAGKVDIIMEKMGYVEDILLNTYSGDRWMPTMYHRLEMEIFDVLSTKERWETKELMQAIREAMSIVKYEWQAVRRQDVRR